jgi:hypothetical protein
LSLIFRLSLNLLVYYVQGDPRAYVVPDAFVAKGIRPKSRPKSRRTYKIWVEGKAPDVVIETTSHDPAQGHVGKAGTVRRAGREFPSPEFPSQPLESAFSDVKLRNEFSKFGGRSPFAVGGDLSNILRGSLADVG